MLVFRLLNNQEGNFTMFKKQMIYMTLILAAFIAQSEAGTIKVVNELKKPFQVVIEPTNDRDSAFVKDISADPESSFEVTFPQLGKITFALKGHVTPFKPEDKCYNLNVEKDYSVTFRDDKTHITCIAEELPKSE